MGGMCARVCPTETLCEEVCVREIAEGKPVEIGRLQRYATDALFATGRSSIRQGSATGQQVAVVGAGPAGLACAHKLATLGHAVTLFEARDKPGGLNEYGIAAYKTVGGFAQARSNGSWASAASSCARAAARPHVTLADLRRDFDAVFLGLGLGAVNALGLDVTGLHGVMDAVAYLADLRQAADLAALPVGRRIVVIGGGMTAIDIASQTKRLGAEEVTIVYRRGPEQMGASAYEQEVAQTDGVLLRHWLRPKRLLAEDGRLAGVELEYTDGRPETLTLACDQLFKAIGQAFLPADLDGGGRWSSWKAAGSGWTPSAAPRSRRLGRRRLRRGRQGSHRGRGRGRQAGGTVDRPLAGPGRHPRRLARGDPGNDRFALGPARSQPLAHQRQDLGRCRLRAAGREGRLRRVLEVELYRFAGSGPKNSATTVSAMSIPAVTPPPVTYLPSAATRA